ncbi:hypothetical protein Q9251_21315 [Alkalihalobacillus macyae]|uniref:hypothetical protein n=1 Tax=Guptibacillus hwajinpoensis TaxID=208199 RepID=UPI00273CA411|nr:hypothetical protein [Alkalihalobacillus macyae]MDP4553398.1 hypothetical protein [Alkalihalobacillus macyae]
MITNYAKYIDKIYKLDMDGDILELMSTDQVDLQNGFSFYVDVLGKEHSDFYIKRVKVEEVDLAFELKINANYNGKEFETLSLGPFNIQEGKIPLFTKDFVEVEKFNFHKQEQFVFIKEVPLQEIESLVEINIPILKFKELPTTRRVIKSSEMIIYLKKL